MGAPTVTGIRELLAGIEERAEAATPAPWHVHDDNEGTDYFPLWTVANDEFYNPTGGAEDYWPAIHLYVDTGQKTDAEFIAHARTDVPRLVAALRAVLDLHKMLPRRAWTGDPDDWCSQCDGQAYPCETVRAITDALGGEA